MRPVHFAVPVLAACLAAAALASEPVGPPFGANRYAASIVNLCGTPDSDDYAASLIEGEKLSVTVQCAKGAALVPQLTVVAPDGTEIVPAAPVLVAKAGGKVLQLRGFVVPSTGRWGVRVKGRDASEGDYSIAFSIGAIPPLKAKKTLNGAVVEVHEIPAIEGTLLDLDLKWKPPSSQFSIESLRDPLGADVPGLAPQVGPGAIRVRGLPLRYGDGVYELRLANESPKTTYTMKLRVRPQGRPSGKTPVKLTDAEPHLNVRTEPHRGISGQIVRFEGMNLQSVQSVLFGGIAVQPKLSSSGTWVEAIPPFRADGALVDVAAVGPDGQACARADYFYYVPIPTVTDLTDLAGIVVRGGPSSGGATLRLRGTGFHEGQTVRFGNSVAEVLSVAGPNELQLVAPVAPHGLCRVSVTDEFGRAGQSGFVYSYKAPATFGASPYSPACGPVVGGTVVTVSAFPVESTDQLYLDGVATPFTYVDSSTLRFTSPTRDPGMLPLWIIDRYGQRGDGPDFEVKSTPEIAAVAIVGGPHLDDVHIPAGGGTVIEVQGANFRTTDVVTLGGAEVELTSFAEDVIEFTSPGGTPGVADLEIVDSAGQSVSVPGAFEYVGLGDETDRRAPDPSAADDLTAWRGAVGDLDGDGLADDLVIVSDHSAGSREEFTRLFLGEAGALDDHTDENFPEAYSDPSGSDDWSAAAVALGDLDGDSAQDIVIAGLSYGGYSNYDARAFVNDGAGRFSFTSDSPLVRTWQVPVFYYGWAYSFFRPSGSGGAAPTALAIGDLDADGDEDLVMATDRTRRGTLHVPLDNVNMSTPGYYTCRWLWSYYDWRGTEHYTSAVRVFDNQIGDGSGMVDVTFPRAPLCGTPGAAGVAFHARDVRLVDLDDDGDLDIVSTWDDPTTMTASGRDDPGSESPMVATRVLLNDGAGWFTDATDDWMPAGSDPEYWQADRLELADLDADGDRDLVLLLRQSVSSWSGSPDYDVPALRILRNDSDRFTDVTESAVPPPPLECAQDDNLRGAALLVADVDGDGNVDIVVGTTEALLDEDGGRARSTRLLRGDGALSFENVTCYLPSPSADSGEADDLLVGDLAGDGTATVILLSETVPEASSGGGSLRAFRWGE